jgi:hypothetical protein
VQAGPASPRYGPACRYQAPGSSSDDTGKDLTMKVLIRQL